MRFSMEQGPEIHTDVGILGAPQHLLKKLLEKGARATGALSRLVLAPRKQA